MAFADQDRGAAPCHGTMNANSQILPDNNPVADFAAMGMEIRVVGSVMVLNRKDRAASAMDKATDLCVAESASCHEPGRPHVCFTRLCALS